MTRYDDMKPWMSRNELLSFAAVIASPLEAQRCVELAQNHTDVSVVGMVHLWATWGCQSVVMPHTFAAALMSSESRGAIEGQALPWPTFEIQVPPGLLHSSHGAVTTILVSKIPETANVRGKYRDHKLCVGYLDTVSWGVNTYRDLSTMLDDKETAAYYDDPDRDLTDYLAVDFDKDVEFRLWKLIARLIAGVVLTINTARIDKPELYPTRRLEVKQGNKQQKPTARANTIKLGRPVEVDCRQAITDYLEGKRKNSPAITFLVRGHWRNQAYGPKRALHRPTWIEPFLKGEGVMEIRPTRIGFDAAKESPDGLDSSR